jgi:pimeloyl-ACP methyl ester carboxylesterase
VEQKCAGEAEINGTRLAYEVTGSGDPVVFVHGFSLDRRVWADQVAAFAARYRVITYDLRGFGQSAPAGAEPYSSVDDLASLLDHLGIRAAHIVGLSFGGGVASSFAVAQPERTRSLVLVDAILSGYSWTREWAGAYGPVVRRARTEGVEAAKALWFSLPIFGPARQNPTLEARLAAMIADFSGEQWLKGDFDREPAPPTIERLGDIRAPTLVIVGERDMADFLAIADRYAAGIRGARKLVLPGVGHLANLEAPTAFNAAALTFLDRY